MEIITSKDNSKFKKVRALLSKSKDRRDAGCFVAEGLRLVSETPIELIRELWVSEEIQSEAAELIDRASGAGSSVYLIPAGLMKNLSDTVNPQGLMAVVEFPTYDRERLLGNDPDISKPLLILLEDIRDPGNMGTIIRTAEGAGVTGIIMTKGCVDLFSPKVVRSTMGSIFRVPFWKDAEIADAVAWIHENGCRIYGAYLNESEVYDRFNYCEGTCFAIGNEANGLSKEMMGLCDKSVIIPMGGSLESLNAAMASGILVYEAARQRRS